VATSLYGVAAAVLLQALNAFVLGRDSGYGQYLSAAAVAKVVSAVYGAALAQRVLGRAGLTRRR
jgi:hypothetical protein